MYEDVDHLSIISGLDGLSSIVIHRFIHRKMLLMILLDRVKVEDCGG
jgi:hypothetical protein